MREEMIHLADAQLAAYNARELEAFSPNFHEEVIVRKLTSDRVIARGMAEFRAVYRTLFERSPELHCRITHRKVLENAVIDQEEIRGRLGEPGISEAVVIYGFREGKIDRVWIV